MDGNKSEYCVPPSWVSGVCVYCVIGGTNDNDRRRTTDDAWANITFAFMVLANTIGHGRMEDAIQSSDVSRCTEQTRVNIVNEIFAEPNGNACVRHFFLEMAQELLVDQLRIEC